MLSRRRLLSLLPAGLVAPAALLPGRVRARPELTERKFLFVYCWGGWDTTMVFTPEFGNRHVDMESDATTATAHGIPFVDSVSRPAVRTFFEAWGDRACVINGMEVRSVTHERCQRILMTGRTEPADDWPSIIAGRSSQALALPHMVVSGPAFSRDYSSRVVRVGSNGQLGALLDRSALDATDQAVALPSADAEALQDAFVRDRARRRASGDGSRAALAAGYGQALDDLALLESMADSLVLEPEWIGCYRDLASEAATVLDCFELGLSRCGIVRSDGWCEIGWDTHSANHMQSTHHELLFGFLDAILADLETRTSPSGAPLADEVVVVVCSEMGRHPQLNDGGGRDHWTYTSAMLLGAGIQGGRVIGALDEDFGGRPVHLETGEASDDGDHLVPGHLGATLLALADIDPADHVTHGAPIEGALR